MKLEKIVNNFYYDFTLIYSNVCRKHILTFIFKKNKNLKKYKKKTVRESHINKEISLYSTEQFYIL